MSLLAAPDPDWPRRAQAEARRWQASLPGLLSIQHIGSTSVSGLPAKPVIDLLAVFADATALDDAQSGVEALGYEWLGEYGLPGRRYARADDPETGARAFQCHSYPDGHPDIARHLAFRDTLRQNAALRAAYTSIKAACAARHPEGGEAYGACKSGWIDKVEARALERT